MPLPFNFALHYALRRFKKIKRDGTEYGTHQLLVCADNINLPDKNIKAMKKIIKTLLDDSKEVSIKIYMETTMYTFMLCIRM
jgi:hypothetical protein